MIAAQEKVVGIPTTKSRDLEMMCVFLWGIVVMLAIEGGKGTVCLLMKRVLGVQMVLLYE